MGSSLQCLWSISRLLSVHVRVCVCVCVCVKRCLEFGQTCSESLHSADADTTTVYVCCVRI